MAQVSHVGIGFINNLGVNPCTHDQIEEVPRQMI